jgi:hypothetical protein
MRAKHDHAGVLRLVITYLASVISSPDRHIVLSMTLVCRIAAIHMIAGRIVRGRSRKRMGEK